MSSDAVPLQTYATALGTVALFDGFNASAGGLQRGLGWDYIAALHPEATYQLLADILASGTYATEGVWTTMTWRTTVNGVETLNRLLLKDLVVISLGVSEIVRDITGNEIPININDAKDVYYRKHPELEDWYPTFDDYVSEIKKDIQSPDEFWKDLNGDRDFKSIYIRWLDGKNWVDAKHAFLVITGGKGFINAYIVGKAYAVGQARTGGLSNTLYIPSR